MAKRNVMGKQGHGLRSRASHLFTDFLKEKEEVVKMPTCGFPFISYSGSVLRTNLSQVQLVYRTVGEGAIIF